MQQDADKEETTEFCHLQLHPPVPRAISMRTLREIGCRTRLGADPQLWIAFSPTSCYWAPGPLFRFSARLVPASPERQACAPPGLFPVVSRRVPSCPVSFLLLNALHASQAPRSHLLPLHLNLLDAQEYLGTCGLRTHD